VDQRRVGCFDHANESFSALVPITTLVIIIIREEEGEEEVEEKVECDAHAISHGKMVVKHTIRIQIARTSLVLFSVGKKIISRLSTCPTPYLLLSKP